MTTPLTSTALTYSEIQLPITTASVLSITSTTFISSTTPVVTSSTNMTPTTLKTPITTAARSSSSSALPELVCTIASVLLFCLCCF